MEGLYTELADGALYGGWDWQVGTPATGGHPIPAGPPTDATGEEVDSWAGKVHDALREHLRQNGNAMNGNLREDTGTAGKEDQVWNHDVYKYESTFEAVFGDERVVKVTTLITSNVDGDIMVSDSAKRHDTWVYVLEYTDYGEINVSSGNQNWISCSGFAPECLGTVDQEHFVWHAHHCGITKERVDALYH